MSHPDLDPARIPRHIAIIMDGNGRWAKQHGKHHIQGHEAGAESVRDIIKACRELHVPALTLYAFSTENWKRSTTEVNALFELLSRYIASEIDEIAQNNIRVQMLGRREGMPEQALADIDASVARTAHNTELVLSVALNYGGRAEIADAARRIAAEAAAGKLDPASVDEERFADYLYLPEYREVDLLIRTSGELRVSNFMLWQISYAEIVVTPVLWPDFRKKDLIECIAQYQARDRRFGGRPVT